MFHIRKCKRKGAWTVQPLQQTKLDLSQIQGRFETIFHSPVVLLIKAQGQEVLVHKDGELLFKQCDDVKLMKGIALEVFA